MTTGAAILAAIQSEGRAGTKAQPIVTAAIKAGDEAAFVTVANGLERMKDKAQRKAFFAILRTRMARGCKALELGVKWSVKRNAEKVYTVTKVAPKGDAEAEAAKLRKALDLVKAHITDPTVTTELVAALTASKGVQAAPVQVEASA